MIITTAVAAAAALSLIAYVVVCGAVAYRFTTARRQSPAPLPPGFGAEPVQFDARDGRARIDAWYLRSPSSRGVVIFVPGKDACRGHELKSSTFALAQELAGSGLSVLMIDLRGHGTSSAARLTYGERERHDVLGALDWLRAHGHREDRIGVLGASMGAATALLAAACEPGIAAVVADSSFVDFGSMIDRQFSKLTRLPRFFLPGTLVISWMLIGFDPRRVRPIDAASTLAGRPVLVVHSEGDRLIPAVDGRAIAEACGGELWTTVSDGHIGSYRAEPERYAARIVEFFSRNLFRQPVADAANDAGASATASRPGQVIELAGLAA